MWWFEEVSTSIGPKTRTGSHRRDNVKPPKKKVLSPIVEQTSTIDQKQAQMSLVSLGPGTFSLLLRSRVTRVRTSIFSFLFFLLSHHNPWLFNKWPTFRIHCYTVNFSNSVLCVYLTHDQFWDVREFTKSPIFLISLSVCVYLRYVWLFTQVALTSMC